MTVKHQLVAADYAVILMMLLISIAIGFKFRQTQNKESSAYDYLMAGKNMFLVPVIFSISVTLVSGISLVVIPSEVYRYDIQHVFLFLGAVIGIIIAVNVAYPVYFQCGVSTSYEYLEMRFGKRIRYIISTIFIAQMVLYTSVVLFPPVLALSSITDLSIELSIIICGSVCSLYCLLGGLKGVMWTDVFQCMLIFIFLISIYVVGIEDSGGIRNVYERNLIGEKLNVDFTLDLITRYTFWNTMTAGIVHGLGGYGASQLEVQRVLSLKNLRRAKLAMYIGILPLSILYVLSNALGLILYSIFFLCDPVLNNAETGVQKYEQIIPYYLVNRFSSMPGMTGLCIAGIFSGSLSSISSALNSLATVAIFDFVKPLSKSLKLSNSKLLLIAKGLTLGFGLLCTVLPFLMLDVSSISQLNGSIGGVVEGPIAVVFAAGFLTTNVTEISAIVALLVGVTFNSWLSFGALISKYYQPYRNLGTNCTSTHTSFLEFESSNLTCSSANMCITENETFILYRMSYLWVRLMGFMVTVVVVFIGVLITGWNVEAVPSNSMCLSPIRRFWSSKQSKQSKNDITQNSKL